MTMRDVYNQPQQPQLQQNNRYFQSQLPPRPSQEFVQRSNDAREEARRILAGKPPVKIESRYL